MNKINPKKITLAFLCILLLLGSVLYSQTYTITKEDYPAIGTTSIFEVDTTGQIPVNLGSAGIDQEWRFTQDLTGINFELKYSEPDSSSYYAETFNDADWVVRGKQWLNQQDFSILGLYSLETFEKAEDDTIFGIGVGLQLPPIIDGGFAFENESVNYPFPLENGKTWIRQGRFWATNILYELIPGWPVLLDGLVSDSSYVVVDGEGYLTIPPDTLTSYQCLRMKIHRTLTIQAFISGSSTPAITLISSFIIYEWFQKNAGMILQVTSRDGEENENYNEASLVVRVISNDQLTSIDCDPFCNPHTEIPLKFTLGQNRPNPFNPTTHISYYLPQPAKVELKIYSILGQEVSTIDTGIKNIGFQEAVWNGKDNNGRVLPGGVYFYRLKAVPLNGGQTIIQTKKMIMTK